MKKHLMILAALMIATPTEARDTVQDDGNEILSMCDSGSDMNFGFCIGYLRGLLHSIQFASEMNNGKGLCVPERATVGQVRDVIVSYVRANPAYRHYDSSLLLMMAVNNAWPCK